MTTSGRRGAAPSTGSDSPRSLSRRASGRRLVIVLFVVLVGLFAAGLWGTIIRPSAYEIRGEVVARAAPDVLLIRHQPVSALGMGAMEMMAVRGPAAALDTARVAPGDRVRLAVRQDGDDVALVWIEKLR